MNVRVSLGPRRVEKDKGVGRKEGCVLHFCSVLLGAQQMSNYSYYYSYYYIVIE
jgi:hypothetical protein